MGNSNTEWKKEMRLFGIVFWLLPLIDVFHIIIGILYSTIAETNGTLVITLMVYKAVVAQLKIYLGARIMCQVKKLRSDNRNPSAGPASFSNSLCDQLTA